MIYLQLFWEFFKTGLFAVGGGMATLPFLREIGARTGWYTYEMMADMIAVSESTPGPIGINMATYVGYTVGGVPGSIVATLGEITPSVIVILIIAAFLRAFRDNRFVDAAFYGIRPASTALIASAGFGVLMLCLVRLDAFRASGELSALFDWKALGLFALVWVVTNMSKSLSKLHPIVFIAASAVIGIVLEF